MADSEKQAMQQDLAELDQLVDEMLDYARLEAQTVRLTFEEVDLVELLENLLEKTRTITWRTDLTATPCSFALDL